MIRKKDRQRQRDFYKKTQQNQNAPRRDTDQSVNLKQRNGPTPTWYYWVPTFAIPIFGYIGFVFFTQYVAMTLKNLSNRDKPFGMFDNYGLFWIYLGVLVFVLPPLTFYVYKKIYALWFNNNAMYLTEDIEEYTNDAYVRTIDHLTQELSVAPDAGLGFDGHASTLMGHMMVSNKGIKKINMPQYDPSVDGYIKRDENGEIVRKMVPMFDEELANHLFQMSGVPSEHRILYNATDYDYNRKLTKREGGGKDKDGKPKRAGAYGRKAYDKLSDYINSEFYPLDTDPRRPAGVYFYDERPVNTILIAITRAGKGQTYIEPAFDVWIREKDKWNVLTTDPKGELLAKFYYPASINGYEIVQFNLMHPHLTNVYNPLANAIQAFRQNDMNKGTALIDSIVETLFPDNGEIWNPAAGNMFRRAVYLLFDYYIEQENYIRYLGHKYNRPQEIIDQEIDKNYSKVTLYNVYVLIGELASKVSKDALFINVDPSAPPVSEKDYLTLIFDAMSLLPQNALRQKAITANNAIKQIAGAQQTIAGIYATLLTGLSVYADDTAIALMSGSLSESFDVAGLGFPRRFGVRFDEAFVKKFRVVGELCEWTFYRDASFTDKYEGKDFYHAERVAPTNWVWCYFAGVLEEDVSYVKLDVQTSDGTVAHTFYFQFDKGYRLFDSVSYVLDPISKKKTVANGTLIELEGPNKDPKISTFSLRQMDLLTNSMKTISRPVIKANQVFYSERPKFLFAITPPHLQVYQKHILLIIKQILDEQYSNSYVVKENRKPIIGTRLMLEEFGNIRSGKQGIPDIDTAASIALGQNVQITFVLQSFQQLRAIYDDAVEKVLRANSSNTIFLKSNDEELINELVRLSGVRHEFRVKSKSVSRKQGDIITVSEPVINYSGEHMETTTLTSNDLLFLAGKSPGNSVTFSSGEMPIVGKLSTITPMAAGLHKQLPQPVGGQYSDATMPSTNTNDSVNFLDNIIDGEALVRARVAHARLWLKHLRPQVEQLAKDTGTTINERDGSLSDLVMNSLYEIYEKEEGFTRHNLSEPTPYWKLAEQMQRDLKILSNNEQEYEIRSEALQRMQEQLTQHIMDSELKVLTDIYKDKKAKNALGYDLTAVSQFVNQLANTYPRPEDLDYDTQDVFEKAKEDERYHRYTGHDEKIFDPLNQNHTEAFEMMIEQIVTGGYAPDGLDVDFDDQTEEEQRIDVKIDDVLVSQMVIGSNRQVVKAKFVIDDEQLIKLVTAHPQIVQRIQSSLSEV